MGRKTYDNPPFFRVDLRHFDEIWFLSQNKRSGFSGGLWHFLFNTIVYDAIIQVKSFQPVGGSQNFIEYYSRAKSFQSE